MKILMFSVRQDEMDSINEYSLEHDMEIHTTDKLLNLETVHMTKGYDGISVLQMADIKDEKIYSILKGYGIRQISLRCTGYNMINFEAAEKYGIFITNIPSYSPHAIAELALTHTMNLIRNMPTINSRLKHNDFSWTNLISPEIGNLTVGIIGVGRIGSVYGKIMNALGAEVLGYDIVENDNNRSFLSYCSSLDELLEKSHVISLHVPLNDDVLHLINSESIAKMRDGVMIVNTSRGPVINTLDLIKGLDSGKIKAAALDVIEGDAPYFGNDFSNRSISNSQVEEVLKHPKIIVTPHIAFYTHNAVENMVTICLDSICSILNNKLPETLVR